jgi:hypothetical protein
MSQWIDVKGWVPGTITADAAIAGFFLPHPDGDGAPGAIRHRAAAGSYGPYLRNAAVHGRMMPHFPMQKRVSPQAQNALENARNRQISPGNP